MFVAGPAAITTTRFHAFWRQYASGRERAVELLVDAVLAEPRLELEQDLPGGLEVAALDRRVERVELRSSIPACSSGRAASCAGRPAPGRCIPGIFT